MKINVFGNRCLFTVHCKLLSNENSFTLKAESRSLTTVPTSQGSVVVRFYFNHNISAVYLCLSNNFIFYIFFWFSQLEDIYYNIYINKQLWNIKYIGMFNTFILLLLVYKRNDIASISEKLIKLLFSCKFLKLRIGF